MHTGSSPQSAPRRESLTLSSTLESVSLVKEKAERLAAELGFDAEDCARLALCVREAMTNAVMHGNDYDPGKQVHVVLEADAGGVRITVTDEGKGLDLAKLPDPLAPDNLFKQSGRGVLLIRSLMDEVQIRVLQPGTEVKMRMKLPRRAE